MIVLGLNIRHLIAQYFSYGLVLLISFSLTVVIARKFGPEIFSVYSASLSVGAILSILNDFGFKSLIQREASFSSTKTVNSSNTILSSAIIHASLTSFLSSLFLCLIFTDFIFIIISISLCFYSITISQFISGWFKGKNLFVRDAINSALLRVVSAISILSIFWLKTPRPELILLAWGVSIFIYNLMFHTWAFKFNLIFPSKYIYKNLIPLFLIDICIVLYFRFDVILMQYIGGLKVEVGNYSAALRVIESFILLTMPIRGILLSQFRKEYYSANMFFGSFLIKLIVAGLAGLIATLIISLNADSIISFLYGDEYLMASEFLLKLSWLLTPAMLLSVITEMVIASENEKTYFWVALIILVFTLPITYVFATTSGIEFIPIIKVTMESSFCLMGLFLITYQLRRRKKL